VEPGSSWTAFAIKREKYGLTLWAGPGSHSRCTLGGMIGNNSCGVHAVAWGKTVDNVERLEVLTYDGLRLEVGLTAEPELARIIQAGADVARFTAP